jgi:hypothetical protein
MQNSSLTAAADRPVFIDQMPDYQEAVRQIEALPRDRLHAVAGELGLSGELQKRDAAMESIAVQAQGAREKLDGMDPRVAAIAAKAKSAAVSSSIAGGVAGIGGGIIAGRRWGGVKGALTGIAAAIAAAGTWFYASMKIGGKSTKESADGVLRDYQALGHEVLGLNRQLAETRERFTAVMATRMLEEQKMLAGQGEEMKLVSTKEPASGAGQSMAAKYAAPPVATHAEAAAPTAAAILQR